MSYVERFVVAVVKLGAVIEVEAKALAADLELTPYEAKMKLASGVPAIVLSTTDEDAAQKLGAGLRSRGSRAIVLRASAVVPIAKMIRVRSFQLESTGLATDEDELPWSDISCLVRARSRTQHDTTEVIKQKKFDPVRAVASGGLVMRSTQKREVVTHHETSEQVLYMFRASGETPWVLREQGTNYSGLGPAAAATANLNIGIACDLIRARATGARFDDSLLRRHGVTDVDLFAHLIAAS
ncbi:MAG TPA: hypothetical protein VGC41_01560 [Kofleriaceae bacterium]